MKEFTYKNKETGAYTYISAPNDAIALKKLQEQVPDYANWVKISESN